MLTLDFNDQWQTFCRAAVNAPSLIEVSIGENSTVVHLELGNLEILDYSTDVSLLPVTETASTAASSRAKRVVGKWGRGTARTTIHFESFDALPVPKPFPLPGPPPMAEDGLLATYPGWDRLVRVHSTGLRVQILPSFVQAFLSYLDQGLVPTPRAFEEEMSEDEKEEDEVFEGEEEVIEEAKEKKGDDQGDPIVRMDIRFENPMIQLPRLVDLDGEPSVDALLVMLQVCF
jgi:hypothetical protein